MHLSKVSLINYRNFSNTKFIFSKGINTVIGENGSGKTNLFRAVRLLLDNNMRRSAVHLEEGDFFRGLPNWRGHWIVISLEFEEVSQDEAIQALFLHGSGAIEDGLIERSTYNLIFRPNISVRKKLSEIPAGDSLGLTTILNEISIDDYETVITGKSSADFNDPNLYKAIVGDFENVVFPEEVDGLLIGAKVPPILSMSKEISFTFVQALRDVVSEFHNNRTNPVLNLLKNKSGEINMTEFAPIIGQVTNLNTAIEELTDVTTVKDDIIKTINDAVGDAYSPQSLSIKSSLSDEAEQLFQSLKLFIAESDDGHEGSIHEMSLGGANLIYLTLKLLEFKYQQANQTIANFLVIEEPEAHIHTHIQKSLFDQVKYPDTQIIYSTHSSHISEASNVKNINIIGKVGNTYEAFQPAVDLTDLEIRGVQRYLDAVRSNLLFAKSVLLVEGDAEEILIPALIKKVLGVSLDELGISLVNIRSTGFVNVALLFHESRVRKNCGIITDLDAAYFPTSPLDADTDPIKKVKKKAIASETKGAARKIALENFCGGNSWLESFYASHTFEVDLIVSGNQEKFINILTSIYIDQPTIDKSISELRSGDISQSGARALTMAQNAGKGWFAILLAGALDHDSVIPEYVLNAVSFAHGPLSSNVVLKILKYRLEKIITELEQAKRTVSETTGQTQLWYDDWNKYIQSQGNSISSFNATIQDFQSNSIDIETLKALMVTLFPDNKIIPILESF